jgi:hypothetical protein
MRSPARTPALHFVTGPDMKNLKRLARITEIFSSVVSFPGFSGNGSDLGIEN